MSDELPFQRAYLRTNYWVQARPQPVALRIGEHSRMLDRVLTSHRVRRWAFITAWNPRSRLLPHWRNATRQRALVRAVEAHGYTWLSGLGDSDDLDWTPEPSLLVLGISPSDARHLGRRFGQNAVVVGRLGSKALLLWCDGGNSDRLIF